jgi:signal transduction histidine kinase
MRRTLALVSAAVTSMVAIAFLIPLAVVVADIARDQAFSTAALQAAAIGPTLSATAGPRELAKAIASVPGLPSSRIAVYLTATADDRVSSSNGSTSGQAAGGERQIRLIAGTARASAAVVATAISAAASFRAPVPGGFALFQPVRLTTGQLALIEVFVPAQLLSRGVLSSWLIMAAVGAALVGVAVLVSDRLAMHITVPARALAAAAARLGDGDLAARSRPAGPPELTAAGEAFNTMAERLTRMIAAERVMAADLPHRLRTPLTALRMNTAALGTGRAADETRLAVMNLEQEIDRIIRAARRPAQEEPSSCDAAEVLQDRMDFWSALADDQGRAWHLTGANRPVRVPVARPDLVAVADALLGNIFLHTTEGTEFAVTLHAGNGVAVIFFADAGPGIEDPQAALERGSSSGGSTGLGLDIARRVAESTGGELRIDRSALGGAQLQLWLRTGPDLVTRSRRSGARRGRISRR